MADKEQVIIDVNKYFKKAANDSGQPITFILNCADLYGAIIQLNEEFIKKTQEYEKYKKLAADFKDVNKQLGYKYLTIKKECEELSRLSNLIRGTQTYLEVCDECKDEILLYPSISGRTNYTQVEVEEISLKKIIQQLDGATIELNRYRRALEEIWKIIISVDVRTRPKLYDFEQDNKILDIINKAKEQK